MDVRILEVLMFIDMSRYQAIYNTGFSFSEEISNYGIRNESLNDIFLELTDYKSCLVITNKLTKNQLNTLKTNEIDVLEFNNIGFNFSVNTPKDRSEISIYNLGYTQNDVRFIVPSSVSFKSAYTMTPKGVIQGEIRKFLYKFTTLTSSVLRTPFLKYHEHIPVQRKETRIEKIMTESSATDPVMFTGTLGLSRRVTIQAVRSNGEYCYTKVSTNNTNKNKLLKEIKVLEKLQTYKFKNFDTPRVLAKGGWEGREYFTQTSYPNRGKYVYNQELSALHYMALEELYHATKYTIKLSNTYYVKEIKRILNADNEIEDDLGILQWIDSSKENLLHGCANHGDFTPWNMKSTKAILFIYDWESYREDGLLFFDAFHYLIQQSILVEKIEPEDIFRKVTSLKAIGHFQKYANSFMLYLVIYLMYNHVTQLETLHIHNPGFAQIGWTLKARSSLIKMSLNAISGDTIS